MRMKLNEDKGRVRMKLNEDNIIEFEFVAFQNKKGRRDARYSINLL